MRTKSIIIAGLAILINVSLAGAMETDTEEKWGFDSWSTGTVTHIEYNPLGLFKVDIPRIPESIHKDKEVEGEVRMAIFSIISGSSSQQSPYFVDEINILKIPFIQYMAIHQMYSKLNDSETLSENPFKATWQMDEPLISLSDSICVTYIEDADAAKADREKEGYTYNNTNEWPEKKKFIRKHFLNSFIFCLWEKATWGKDYYDTEFFNLPLITTYATKRGYESRTIDFLESPINKVFQYARDNNSEKMRILQFAIIGSLFQKKITGDSCKWSVLYSPLIGCLIHNKQEGDTRDTVVLEFPYIFPQCARFNLWRIKENPEEKNREILDLPLIGPLWSIKTGADDTHNHHCILPRIFDRN